MTNDFMFTSESVSEGHPDKVADQISDSVLDAVLRDDPQGRVACETLVTTGLVVVAGEITTSTYIDIAKLVRATIADIGYTNSHVGFDAETCGVSPSYSTVTCDFPSGRSQGSVPSLRTSARRRVRLCASTIGSGINSGVSRQA